MSYGILTQNYNNILTQDGLYYLSYFRDLPPLSSGTEYTFCQICNGVLITVSPPHPVWTNNEGRDVIQLNAVALGGFNGLNN